MALSIHKLSKTFKLGTENLTVFVDLTFEMDKGETLAFTGPAGSGKTTLINILGCLDSPSSGSYLIGDTNPLDFNRKKTSRFRRDYIGFLFQDSFLLPQLTVLENVLVPCMATGLPLKTDVNFAKSLLDQLGLSNFMDFLPSRLTTEQKQRAAAARALIKRPSLLLADEPTACLIPRSASVFLDDVLAVQKECGSMFILATDSPALAQKMNRTATIVETRFVFTGRRDAPQDAPFARPAPAQPVQPAALSWEEVEEDSDQLEQSASNVEEFRRRFQ